MKKIYKDSMTTRVTIRLDQTHLKILSEVMKKNNISSKSEAIRYIIEKNKR